MGGVRSAISATGDSDKEQGRVEQPYAGIQRQSGSQRIILALSGLLAGFIMLVFFRLPELEQDQRVVMRVFVSLAAAFLSSFIPGEMAFRGSVQISPEKRLALQGTASLAVFFIVLLLPIWPDALVASKEPSEPPNRSFVDQTPTANEPNVTHPVRNQTQQRAEVLVLSSTVNPKASYGKLAGIVEAGISYRLDLDQYSLTGLQCVIVNRETTAGPIAADEELILRDYVGGGGTLIVITDNSNPTRANFQAHVRIDHLAQVFHSGVTARRDHGGRYSRIATEISVHPLTDGVRRVRYAIAGGFDVDENVSDILIWSHERDLPRRAIVAAHAEGAGHVVFIADSHMISDTDEATFADDASTGTYKYDNARFVSHLCG